MICESHKFAALTLNTRDHAELSTTDEEFLWTLLDYNAWCNMGPDDVPSLSEDQEITGFWPDMNISLDGFCSPFPHFDQ